MEQPAPLLINTVQASTRFWRWSIVRKQIPPGNDKQKAYLLRTSGSIAPESVTFESIAPGAYMTQPVSIDPLSRLAERQDWLSAEAEEKIQATITETVLNLGGDTLRRALHGDWLHEPLHAVLTDVPVGSWTAAVVFDAAAAITGSKALDNAADATVVLGLLGATAAAVTGMNDWAEIRSPAARRIGLVHAALNIAGTGLFLASSVARWRKARPVGRVLAAAGLIVISASAHLGGSLVYEHGIGVAERPEATKVTEDMHG